MYSYIYLFYNYGGVLTCHIFFVDYDDIFFYIISFIYVSRFIWYGIIKVKTKKRGDLIFLFEISFL